ncbi:hypothetical protein SHDE107825_19300 [Shewanella denitrificans]
MEFHIDIAPHGNLRCPTGEVTAGYIAGGRGRIGLSTQVGQLRIDTLDGVVTGIETVNGEVEIVILFIGRQHPRHGFIIQTCPCGGDH